MFGGFYSVAVTQKDAFFHDRNIFVFSFESHGRCMTPQRFVVKDRWHGGACVAFYDNDYHGRFVVFMGGDGWFIVGNEKSRTLCDDVSHGFEGIEDTTLTGHSHPETFTCCRLVAVQLE